MQIIQKEVDDFLLHFTPLILPPLLILFWLYEDLRGDDGYVSWGIQDRKSVV